MPQPAHKHVTPDEAYDSFTWFDATTTLPEKEGLKYMTRYDENQDEILEVFSGIERVRGFFDNRYLLAQSYTSYKEGLRHGPAFEWHPNAQLKSAAYFLYGHLMGGCERYRADGTSLLASEPDEQLTDETGSKGQRQGKCFEWWPNGKLKRMATYDKGELHGLVQEYHYATGTVSYEGWRKNGLSHGISRKWDEDGFQTYETVYEDGGFSGYQIMWVRGEKEYYRFERPGESVDADFSAPDDSPYFTFIPKWLEQ